MLTRTSLDSVLSQFLNFFDMEARNCLNSLLSQFLFLNLCHTALLNFVDLSYLSKMDNVANAAGEVKEFNNVSNTFRGEVYMSEAGYVAGDTFCQCGRPTHRHSIQSIASPQEHHRLWSIENDIPWTATFVRNDRDEIFCSGVLLNTLYILTAANCVYNRKPGEMTVVLNEGYHLPTNETIQLLDKFTISKIIVHPKYNESSPIARKRDIALVRLDEEINFFEKALNPVCLPIKNDVYYKKFNGTITKWSEPDLLDSRGPDISSQTKLILPLLSNQQCNTETKHKGMISDDMLCAGFLDNSESCKGDSGGPMTIKRGDRHHLVGIASWGEGCSVAYSPSIYTRVGRFINWILRNTEDAEWCAE